MNLSQRSTTLVLAGVAAGFLVAAVTISFQARLNGPGVPQNGIVDLEISIYDAVTLNAFGGSAVVGQQ